uniref:Protein phosphatase 1H n=1 Tax=Hirondellea gigas TaxID=1518452 RepID=A0A6A7FUR5_9CRUS
MFNKFKSVFYSAVVGGEDEEDIVSKDVGRHLPQLQANNGSSKTYKDKRLTYCRPTFLQLNSADEVSVTADHALRPIICPRIVLPWHTGYAETVNAGKSKYNEDQSSVVVGYLTRSITKNTTSSLTNSNTAAVTNSTNNSNNENAAITSIQTNGRDSCHATTSLSEQTNATNSDSVLNITSDPNIVVNNIDARIDSTNNEKTITCDAVDCSNDVVSAASSGCPHHVNGDNVTSDGKGDTAQHNGSSSLPLDEDLLFVDKADGMLGVSLPYYYFAVFDGHAGWGAAVYASQQLQQILESSLNKVIEYILPDSKDLEGLLPWQQHQPAPDVSSVVVGALEQAFWLMDKKVEKDRHRLCITGGCTACVALFIMGKLYVANAGDSRATLSLHEAPYAMSYDFTPETENYRVRKLGSTQPELLGGEYNPIEFLRRPLRRELGTMALSRYPYMAKGWVYKKVTEDDLKVPLVCGSGKRSRVMATIGVTRGFGDHDLKAQCTSILIKPFLSSEPEVRIIDLSSVELSDTDVLILATDGLWDITSNGKAVSTLLHSMNRSLHHFPSSDPNKHKYRYMSAAQDLVMSARGKLTQHNWRTSDNKHATIDDITAFIVPLKPYQEEHDKWKRNYELAMSRQAKGVPPHTVTLKDSSRVTDAVNDVNKGECASTTSILHTPIDLTSSPQSSNFVDPLNVILKEPLSVVSTISTQPYSSTAVKTSEISTPLSSDIMSTVRCTPVSALSISSLIVSTRARVVAASAMSTSLSSEFVSRATSLEETSSSTSSLPSSTRATAPLASELIPREAASSLVVPGYATTSRIQSNASSEETFTAAAQVHRTQHFVEQEAPVTVNSCAYERSTATVGDNAEVIINNNIPVTIDNTPMNIDDNTTGTFDGTIPIMIDDNTSIHVDGNALATIGGNASVSADNTLTNIDGNSTVAFPDDAITAIVDDNDALTITDITAESVVDTEPESVEENTTTRTTTP